MKIVKPNEDFPRSQQIRLDLLQLIAQPSAAEAPPCPGCSIHRDPKCSAHCEHAAQGLSTDPASYPIEPHVIPLVYELATARLIQPCWSCEGHVSPDGGLWKLPQVSFYSRSAIYPQLLLRHIAILEGRKQLCCSWHVALSDFGQTWDVTYTLEPNLNYDQLRTIHLDPLHQDLSTLAFNLCANLKTLAGAMLNELPDTASHMSPQRA